MGTLCSSPNAMDILSLRNKESSVSQLCLSVFIRYFSKSPIKSIFLKYRSKCECVNPSLFISGFRMDTVLNSFCDMKDKNSDVGSDSSTFFEPSSFPKRAKEEASALLMLCGNLKTARRVLERAYLLYPPKSSSAPSP